MYNRDPYKNTRVAEIFSLGKLSEQVRNHSKGGPFVVPGYSE